MRHDEWLAYVREHVRADFETGFLYWKHSARGRNMYKPLGGPDTNGYIKTQIACRPVYAHQVVFYLYYGYWAQMIDHKNRIQYDNKPSNLEETNHKKNALNSKVWDTNTSGVKGASITAYGNYKVTKCGQYLGTFKTKEEAIDAYNKYK